MQIDIVITIEKKYIVSGYLHNKIVLLKNKDVIRWLYGDLSFLTSDLKGKNVDKTTLKKLEDSWGQKILKTIRPDLKLDKQWTNKFGEYICQELLILMGNTINKPTKKMNYQPDCETEDSIWEVKTGTYYTSGTAGEKILGCPFKYSDIPRLYSKPLKIICIGGAEKVCREHYGNLLGEKTNITKKKFLDFYRENGIEYIGISDLLKNIEHLI